MAKTVIGLYWGMQHHINPPTIQSKLRNTSLEEVTKIDWEKYKNDRRSRFTTNSKQLEPTPYKAILDLIYSKSGYDCSICNYNSFTRDYPEGVEFMEKEL